MGVTGLWQILQPCARPIKIETLNRKRLAVDASIWIYQFLKAVRDKEGNALRNSHVVGFFRRICKLLFFGIKPVFVFDGGAPALKRQTIRARKSRREGRREDAVRTAGKLLAVQMQRRAEEDEAQRRAERERAPEQEETIPDEGLVYVDELQMNQQERQQNRKFCKTDQYHLPDLSKTLQEMGAPDDPRVMSLEELQEYAQHFETGEDINVYDFSKIDYDSPFFTSLPASDRYNILNAARLRSRLRMGHSKEQLDSMFPDRMAFSKFQIERVQERNELTQRLMHLNGFEDAVFGGGRVAGEKGREYVLVRNEGVEGGWALGVIGDEGKEEKPIDVDKPVPAFNGGQGDESEEDEFEDVPIVGLNRLPKRRTQNEQITDRLMEQRRAVYSSRRQPAKRKPKPKPKQTQDPNPLFVQGSEDEGEEPDIEEVDDQQNALENDNGDHSEDEELQKAIAMSLEKGGAGSDSNDAPESVHSEDDDMMEVFQQRAAEEQRPLPKGSGRAIANIVNKRAFNVAPESREITSFGVPTQKPESDSDDEGMDLQAALAESRQTKRKTSPPRRQNPAAPPADTARDIAQKAGFKGPLPFEKLDLGSSLLGKKKMQERTEAASGGFENPQLAAKEPQKKAEPLPPWFSGDLDKDIQAQKASEAEDRRKAREYESQFQFQERNGDTLRRADTNEIIDLDADDDDTRSKGKEVINLDPEEADEPHQRHVLGTDNGTTVADDVRMGDVADEIRAEPAIGLSSPGDDIPQVPQYREASIPESDRVRESGENDELEWSDSEPETDRGATAQSKRSTPSEVTATEPIHIEAGTVGEAPKSPSADSDELEFEDVEIPARAPVPEAQEVTSLEMTTPPAAPELPQEDILPEDDEEEFDDFSDPEDADLLRALTLEAEEHARFASSLNNKTQAQSVLDYERELKQLRNQQKKDRRDADEVTQIMIQECQALLRLFGLPYITAPMEAEAQCAELVRLGLVDGIVTDDSDCFLFGGTRVYKNMFNQAKFVECYLTSDMEKEFDLTRDRLISVAHLLGSDYTEGLPGIGPVTAMEILSEFPTLDDFKAWWTAVQSNQISKSEDAKSTFRKKFRKNATKIFLPPTFPDARVARAYQQPEVDATTEAFQWGVPDLEALRSYLMATIGWSQERTDEVLVPVIKDMNRRTDEGTQANITAFFDGSVGAGATGRTARGEGFAPRKRVEGSKRMGSALSKMAERAKRSRNDTASEVVEDSADASEKPAAKPKPRAARKRKTTTEAVGEASDNDADFEEPQKKKSKRKPRAQKAVGRKKGATSNDDE